MGDTQRDQLPLRIRITAGSLAKKLLKKRFARTVHFRR